MGAIGVFYLLVFVFGFATLTTSGDTMEQYVTDLVDLRAIGEEWLRPST